MASYTFVLVADGDTPVYEAEFQSTQKKDGPDTSHLNQLIIHAALDMVDETMWTTNTMCGRARFPPRRLAFGASRSAPRRDARAPRVACALRCRCI